MVTTSTKLARKWLTDAKPRQLRMLPTWAEEEIRMPEGRDKGLRFKQDTQPYSRLLLAELCSGRWRRHVITGPVQSGKSFHAFVLVILYYLFEMQENVIVGLPMLDMAETKWKTDILPAIKSSPYAKYLPTTGPGSKGGTPNEIHFLNGVVLKFMAGGGGDGQRAGATSRILVVTETDKLDEVGGTSREADKLSQLEDRVESFGLNARIYMECTVSWATGATWRNYLAGSASRIVCPCVHCDEYVSPEREHLVGWEAGRTVLEAGRLAKFSCPSCGGCYTEDQRRRMNIAAKLIHKGQKISKEGVITGKMPETDTLGFRWSAFNNLFVETELLGRKEWSAQHGEKRELAEITLKQKTWCIPTNNDDTDSLELTEGQVRGSATGYEGRVNGLERGVLPDDTELVTAFIDLSRRILQWEVDAWRPDEVAIVDYGNYQTEQPDVIGTEEAIEIALGNLIKELDEKYPIGTGLIDCSDWPDIVWKFTKNPRGRWHSAQGAERYVHPKEAAEDKKPSPDNEPWFLSKQKRKPRVWVFTFDTSTFKHRVHDSFRLKPLDEEGKPARGRVTLFGDDPNLHAQYAEQVTAERYVAKFIPGKGTKETWEKIRRHNHFLDTRVGNTIARLYDAARKKNHEPAAVHVADEPKEQVSKSNLSVSFSMRPSLTPGG